jgi:tetratricopeptide (TPR) repeat protein
MLRTDYSLAPEEQYLPEVVGYACQALELDASLSEAHGVLGIAYYHMRKWKEGDVELRRGVELDPSNGIVGHWYALGLARRGEMVRAIEKWKKAMELDPFSLQIRGSLGFVSVLDDREEGVGVAKSAVELDESSLFAHTNLGYTCVVAGMTGPAAEEAGKIYQLARERDFNFKAHSATIYALTQKREEALKILQELQTQSRLHYLDPCLVAMIYAGLGDQENSTRWLRKVRSDRGTWTWIGMFVHWDEARDTQEFKELTKRFLTFRLEKSQGSTVWRTKAPQLD